MGESHLVAIGDGYLTGQEVRAILGIGKTKFIALCHSGEFADVIKVGVHFRVSERSVKEYIERNRVTPKAAS